MFIKFLIVVVAMLIAFCNDKMIRDHCQDFPAGQVFMLRFVFMVGEAAIAAYLMP